MGLKQQEEELKLVIMQLQCQKRELEYYMV